MSEVQQKRVARVGVTAEVRKQDAEFWRGLALKYERGDESVLADGYAKGICVSLVQALEYEANVRHRKQFEALFYSSATYWWPHEPEAGGLVDRAVACCFVAAMVEAGDL